MKDLNFLLREMTHLRYYIPIVIEGNKRGLKSKFCIIPSNKYNCPLMHKDVCKRVMKEHNIETFGGPVGNIDGYWFVNENSGLEITKEVAKTKKAKIIVTTYQTDFTQCYNSYEELADYIMMPSQNISKYYGFESSKNLYLGIPKYDTVIDKEKVVRKYKLNPAKKKVLMMWLKSRDLSKFPIDIVQNFNELGWQVLVKARAKDPVSEKTKQYLLKNDNLVFYDGWYPHTSQELLEASNLVVNCGSTTIEECVMHEVPLINFDIKPNVRHGKKQKYRVTHDYLYEYEFCNNITSLNKKFNTAALESMTQDLLQKNDLKSEFKKCKKDWLYDHKNTCKHLLDVLIS